MLARIIDQTPEHEADFYFHSAHRAGMRNIIRAFFLAFLATTAGCLFSFTLPDGVASLLGKTLPAWVYANQVRVSWIHIVAINHTLCRCGGPSTDLKLMTGPEMAA